MKKLVLLLLFSVVLVAGEWSTNLSSERIGNKYTYTLDASFTALDTLTSKTKEIRDKDYDVSWTTHPFTAYFRVQAVDSITATVSTWYIYGVIDSQQFVVDTLTVNIGTKTDSINYTTLDFNNLKFPEYLFKCIGDSCTSKLVIF